MHVCLQYADGDIELGVPQNRIRPQKFVVDDLVDVNCGGKGEWHAAEVVDVEGDTYKVKYRRPGIKWVTEKPVYGVPGQKYDKHLSVYCLLGWVVVSRKDGEVVVRRPPQPLSPRGFAVCRRVTKSKILPVQVETHLLLQLHT